MRTYTITKYDMEDYNEYEENITIDDIINKLEYAKRGYIGDYNYTGDEDDFELFKIQIAMSKAIDLLEKMKQNETK